MNSTKGKLQKYWAVCDALQAIYEQGLYRETHGSFEEYCRNKFGDEVFEIYLKYVDENVRKPHQVLERMQAVHDRLSERINEYGIEGGLEHLYGRLMTACIEQKTLVSLLVKKGILDSDEYMDWMIKAYEEEL